MGKKGKKVSRTVKRPVSAMRGSRCCMCGAAASYVAQTGDEKKSYCCVCWLLLPEDVREASKE
jgi:hypothetical protein